MNTPIPYEPLIQANFAKSIPVSIAGYFPRPRLKSDFLFQLHLCEADVSFSSSTCGRKQLVLMKSLWRGASEKIK